MASEEDVYEAEEIQFDLPAKDDTVSIELSDMPTPGGAKAVGDSCDRAPLVSGLPRDFLQRMVLPGDREALLLSYFSVGVNLAAVLAGLVVSYIARSAACLAFSFEVRFTQSTPCDHHAPGRL